MLLSDFCLSCTLSHIHRLHKGLQHFQSQFSVNSRSITSLIVCLNGSDLICHTVANVLGSVSLFPPGEHLAAVCPRGPDSVPCRLVLNDDLRASCEVHKFVYDTILRIDSIYWFHN